MPAQPHSYALARLAVLESVRVSFDATTAVARHRNHQVADLVIGTAVDIGAFHRARTPAPCTAETLLVFSVHGKGIVMRPDAPRPAPRKAAYGAHQQQGARPLAELSPLPRAPPHPPTP
ncbi:hypothetical protein J1792_32520 [Streptomyces triculaminicus]|uniref:Uncharacterized protein n=1 Tax=Streptomyces triculaminicus TaxID=2816232 RepID=A0A939JUY7_9ACTN|nr:hypothetical protein [Streptomyces triculaminicus]MBO0657269.1 hypothetical protein [Streptomyces triculaminicus]